VPRTGVYAVLGRVADDRFGGMMNIGKRPSFEVDGAITCEAHLFDFDADLYGRDLSVQFLSRIRDERRFSGMDELAAQLIRDEGASRAIIAGHTGK